MRALWCIGLLAACRQGDQPTDDPVPTGLTGDSAHEGSSWIERRAPSACLAHDEAFVAELLPHPAEPSHRFAGGGAAALHADNDGVLDLLLTGSGGPRVLRGPDFVDELAMPSVPGPITGATVADLDGDGVNEIFLTLHGPPDVLLRRAEQGWAVDERATFPEGHSQSAAVADVTGDGLVDLLVAGHGIPDVVDDQVTIVAPGTPTRLYAGRGDGGFDDLTDSLPRAFRDGYTFVVAPVQLDDDPRVDLYTANDYPNWIPQQAALATDGGWAEPDPSLGLSPSGAGMGLGIGDVNDDGIDDLLLPIWNKVFLLTSVPGVGWVQTATRDGFTLPDKPGAWVGWGGVLEDIDHDGHLDALVAFGHLDTLGSITVGGGNADNLDDQPILGWLQRDGRFELTDMNLPSDGAHRGFVVHDLDGDGGLDLVAPRLDGGVDLLRSTCRSGAWLTIALDDRGADGIGAQLVVDSGTRRVRRTVRVGGTSLLSSWPAVAHVGLGAAEQVSLEVRWPDGSVERFEGLHTRQHLVVHRGDEQG